MRLSAVCDGILTLSPPITKTDITKFVWNGTSAVPEIVSLKVQKVLNMELSGQSTYIDMGYDDGKLWKTLQLGDYLHINIVGRDVKVYIVHNDTLQERCYMFDISSWDPFVVA